MIVNLSFLVSSGRVYDPTTARFLSADPHIQAPSEKKSYNRYSYVKNNPLKYTDSSGFFFKKLWKSIKKIVIVVVVVVIAFYTGGAALAAMGVEGATTAAMYAAASRSIDGSWRRKRLYRSSSFYKVKWWYLVTSI